MTRLARTLAAMEDSLLALERRGINLRAHAVRQDPVTLKLPIYHVFLGNQEHWFTTRERARRVRRPRSGRRQELDVSDRAARLGDGVCPAELASRDDNGKASAKLAGVLHIVELHEVRTINNMLGDLAKMGFEIDLFPRGADRQRRAAFYPPPRRARHRTRRPAWPVAGRPRRWRDVG